MANKKINELSSRTPSLTDLILVGDPSSGYSYKATVTVLTDIIQTDIADAYVTLDTTQTISGAKTFSNVITATSVANAASNPNKFLVLNGSNIINYRTGSQVLSDIGGQGALTLTTTGTSGAATLVGNTLNIPQYQGVISLSAIGSTPNANGATLSSNTLNLQPASATYGGVVTTDFQELAGQKRFTEFTQFDKYIEVKNRNSYGVSWGYTSFVAKDTASFGIVRGHQFSPTPITYEAFFNYGSTGTITYTLPSTSGTLALTSDITSALTSYVPSVRQLTINGTTYNLSADRTWSVGTVTSVAALTLGTTGTDLSSSVATGTSTPVITLNVPTASATNRGALSSTDWSTFNNKQSAITLTTTGSSGAAKIGIAHV